MNYEVDVDGWCDYADRLEKFCQITCNEEVAHATIGIYEIIEPQLSPFAATAVKQDPSYRRAAERNATLNLVETRIHRAMRWVFVAAHGCTP